MYKFKYMLQQEAGEPQGGAVAQEMTEQEVSQRLSAAESTDYDAQDGATEDKTIETAKPDAAASTPVEEQKPSDFIASPLWDSFKSDEGFVMPTDLTADNESEMLSKHVAAKFGIETPVLHPLAKQIQDMSVTNPNLTINDLVNQVSNEFVDASKMSIDEKISFDFFARYGKYDETNNPDGLTDDDISEQVKTMTKIQKQELASQIDKRIDEYNKSLMTEYDSKNAEKYEANYNNILAVNDKAINDIKMKIDKVDSIYGIPVSQEEHNNWLDEFKSFITPDKTTGIRKLDVMLSDDLTLYKLFVMAVQGEDKFRELITQGRESTKEDIFKKLGLTPTFGGSRSTDHQNLDFEQEGKLLSMAELKR